MSPEQNKTKYILQDRTNLTLLVLILGILSLISISILMLSFFRQLYPFGFAAINKQLNYQGKLQDADGITVPDGSYNIKFTIYDASSGGNILWTARESDACGAPFNPAAKPISVTNGVFSTLLGETGDCAINLDFNSDSYYLGITVGADSEMTPRKRIGAAGYAFNADLLDGISEEYFAQLAQNETVTGSWAFTGDNTAFGNANTDTVTFTAYINSDIFVGANAETIDNTGFTMTGAGAGFFADELGVEGSVYTDTSFIVGASTIYGDGSITTTGTTDLVINPAGGDVSITDDNFSVDGTTFYVDATNNRVGIGTLIPSFPLHISSSETRGLYSVTTSTTAGGVAGVYGEASGGVNAAVGVWGEASSIGTYTNYGGYFTAAGNTGRGVYGEATAATGTNYGGYFIAAGNAGRGVYGEATSSSGQTYGGYFVTQSTSGTAPSGVYGEAKGGAGSATGVRGIASATGGVLNYGGYFEAAGAGGGTAGVYGKVTSATSTIYGVRGEASNATSGVASTGGYFTSAGGQGRGVYGAATYNSTSTINYGGYFEAAGIGAGTSGVYGTATASAAVANYGGYFRTSGTGTGASGVYGVALNAGTVYGVRGEASSSSAVTNYGGYFTAGGTGTGASGVYGLGFYSGSSVQNYGGYFQANGGIGRGVYGVANSTGAYTNYGGYFVAKGTASGTSGVYGTTYGTPTNAVYGVQGVSTGTGSGAAGVYGTTAAAANNVYGVYGNASNNGAYTNYGGYFTASGDTGRGVYGEASDSGTVTNYGGYFVANGTAAGTSGVYGTTSGTIANAVYGVQGVSTGTGSGAAGVYGTTAAAANNVYGVYGNASNNGAYTNYGGYFEAAGQTARAVSGVAINTTGTNFGGYFESYGTGMDSAAVYGKAWANGVVANHGGYFVAQSQNGRGVSGWANGTGMSYGGYFTSNGETAGAAGVYAKATGADSVAGVYSEATGAGSVAGVYGAATNDGAVNNLGGYFIAYGAGENSTGVSGTAPSRGVRGEATATGAVTNYGGYFSAAGNTGQAVRGEATATGAVTNYGGWFQAMGDTGYGVYGQHTGSGSGYGVYGKAGGSGYGVYGYTENASAWGGYFTGGYGLYASRINVKRSSPDTNDTPNEVVIEGSLCVDDSTASCSGTPTDGTIYAESTTITEIDLAENFESSEMLEAGDVVSVDPHSNQKIIKSKKSYDNTVIGIVSTKPGLLLGGSSKTGSYPIALAGRVPVKVSGEPIQIGDKLTTGSTPGVAMKAAKSGPVIGVALEPWSGTGVGKIVAFVNIDWSGGINTVTEIVKTAPVSVSGNITFDKLTTDLDANGFAIKNISKIVSKDEIWSIDENGVLKIAVKNDGETNADKDAGYKKIYGLSSTQVEIILSGSSKLEKGQALVDFNLIDPEFIKIIDSETPLKISVTPTEPCNGLYVAEKYPQGFKVKELNSGTSNASFDWIVIGRRKGY